MPKNGQPIRRLPAVQSSNSGTAELQLLKNCGHHELKSSVVNSKSHIAELDGVRGLAVLMVLIWHYANCQGAAELGRPIAYIMRATGLFWSGVDLFFVLSGFLIGGILIDNAGKPRFYRTFYIRRAARILPVYVLLLILFFTCRSSLDRSSFGWLFNDAIPDLSYLSFTQNIFMGLNDTFGSSFLGITWSLAVEEQFYLVIPLVLLITGSKGFSKAVIVLALLAPILRLAMPGLGAFVNMPFRMDALLMGVGLAIAFRSEAIAKYIHGNKALLWSVFLVLLAGMGDMTFRRLGYVFFDPFAPAMLAMFYASFISLAIVYRGSRITAILRSSFLVRLGMYSYGLYMYHQMVSGLMHGYFRNAPPAMNSTYGAVLTLISLSVSAVIAILSYHTFEAYLSETWKTLQV